MHDATETSENDRNNLFKEHLGVAQEVKQSSISNQRPSSVQLKTFPARL
jgi:hypothetical protein